MTVHNAGKGNTRIRRDFSASLMSDTKWRKVFFALTEPSLKVYQLIIKFTDTEREQSIRRPPAAALHPPKPYVDLLEFGPIPLRSIEWLEIPAVMQDLASRQRNGACQDLDGVRAALGRLGLFSLEDGTLGLRIVGHVRRPRSN